jgi:hypothetical protein
VGIVLGVLGALLGLGLFVFLLRRKPQEKESYEGLQKPLLQHDGLEMMESVPAVETSDKIGSGSSNAVASAHYVAFSDLAVPSPVWLEYVLYGAHITVKSAYGSSQTTGATLMNGSRFTADQRLTIANTLPDGGDQVWLHLASANPPPLDQGWVFVKHPSTGTSLCRLWSETAAAPADPQQQYNTDMQQQYNTGMQQQYNTDMDETNLAESPAPVQARNFSQAENYGTISTETYLLETLTEEILELNEGLIDQQVSACANCSGLLSLLHTLGLTCALTPCAPFIPAPPPPPTIHRRRTTTR